MSTEDVSGTDASRSAGLLQDIEHRYPAIYRRRQQRHARQEALNISKTVSDHELHVHFKDEPSVDLVSNTQTPRDTARYYSNNLEKSNGFLDTSEQEDISNCSKDNNSSTFSEKSRKVNGWLKIKDELWPRSSESADREGFGQQHTKSVVSNQSLQDRLQKNAEMLNHLLYRKSPFLSHQRLDQSSPVLDIESGSDASSLPYDKSRHKPSYQRSSSLFSVPFSRPEYEQEHSFPSDANVSDQMPPMDQDVSHSYENRSDGHDYTDNLTEHKSFTEICQNLCKQRKNKAYEDSGNLCFSCSQSVKISGSSTLLDSPCDSAIDVESSSIKSSHSVEKLSVQIPQNGLQVSDISNLPKMPDNQVKISTWKVEPADFQWIHQNDCVGDRQCSVTNDSDIHHLGVSAVTGLECVNPRFLCHVDADSTDLRYLQDGLSKLGQPSCGSSTNRDDLSIRSLSSGYTDSEIFNHTPRSIYTPRSNVTTAGGTPRRIAMKWRVQSAATKHTATEDSGHSSEKELEEIFFNPKSRQHAGDAFSTPRSYHLSDDTDDIDDTVPRFVNPAQDNKTSELKLRKKRHYIVKRPQSTPLFGSMQSFDNRISKTDEIFNNKGGVSGLSSNSDSDVCRNLKARSKSASDCENLRNQHSSESSHRTEEANQNSFSSCSNETDSNCRNSHVNDAAKCWHPNNDRDIEFFMRAEFLDSSMKPKKNRLKKFLKKKRGKYNPMLQEPQLNCNAMQRPLSMPNLLFDNAFVCSESKKLNKSFDELSSPSRLLRTCDTNALHGISLQKGNDNALEKSYENSVSNNKGGTLPNNYKIHHPKGNGKTISEGYKSYISKIDTRFLSEDSDATKGKERFLSASNENYISKDSEDDSLNGSDKLDSLNIQPQPAYSDITVNSKSDKDACTSTFKTMQYNQPELNDISKLVNSQFTTQNVSSVLAEHDHGEGSESGGGYVRISSSSKFSDVTNYAHSAGESDMEHNSSKLDCSSACLLPSQLSIDKEERFSEAVGKSEYNEGDGVEMSVSNRLDCSKGNLLFSSSVSDSAKELYDYSDSSFEDSCIKHCQQNINSCTNYISDTSINRNGFRHLETSSSSRRHSEPEVQDIKSRLKPNNSGNSLESGLKNNKQEIISNVQTIHNGFSQPLSVLDRHNIEGTNSDISWSNASDCGSEPNQSSNYTSIGNTSQNISELDSASFSSQAITNKGYPDGQFSEEFRNKTDVLIDYDTTQPGIYNAQTQQRIGKQNYISNEKRINCHNSCVSQKKIQSFSYPCISSRHPGLFMNDEENHSAQKRTQSLSCPSTPSHRQISDCAGQISSLLFDLQNELHLGQTVNVLTTEGEYCSGDERGRDSLESEDEFERIKHTNIQVRRFSYSESERNVKMVSDSKFSDAAVENVNSLSNTHVPASRKDDVNSDKVNETRDSTEQLQKPVKKVRTIFTTSKSSTESIDSTGVAEDSDSTPRKSDFPFVSVSPHNNPCNKTDFCDDISPYATSGGMESKGINSSELTKDITNKPYWKNDIRLHQISSSKDPYATIGELSDKDMDEDVGGLNKVDDKPGIPAAVSRKEDSYLMNSCNGEELNSCYDKEDMYATINKNKVITVDHTGDGNKNQKLFAGRHSVSEIQNMEHKSSFEGLEGACGGDGDDEVFSKEEYCPPVPDRKYKRSQSSSRLKASKELSGSRSSLLDKVGSKIKSMKKAISMDNGLDDIDKEEKKKNKEKKVEKSLMSLKSLTAFFSKKRQHKLSATTDVSADPALQNLPAKDGKSKKCHKYQKKKSKAVPSIGSVESPTQFRLIGKLTAINPDGSQMVELKKPPHGPIGFYIARGTANYDYGLLVSRFSADNPEKLFAGILGVGDEILEINETPVTHLTLEEVYELMAASDKLILKVFPLFARKDV